jgi:hypothetical protein
LLCFYTLAGYGQNRDVHITGELIEAKMDTVKISIISSDGEVISKTLIGENHYSIFLKESRSYFVVTRCGPDEKLLTVHCRNMGIESIKLDVDFNTDADLTILLEQPGSREYLLIYQYSRRVKDYELLRGGNGY